MLLDKLVVRYNVEYTLNPLSHFIYIIMFLNNFQDCELVVRCTVTHLDKYESNNKLGFPIAE